ncbi:Os09g0250300 [Oryza sativa Japonica Group]|uniref:Os09g0250300 protein n=1 Tax=Oryza sativa subsp. japonica TaxID=39947 RepID=Q0J374_ORYSJ|nr:Os09g0250300 [Oryza sativa Japonica Group]|eukprot:NP_001062677.1 Os09g0250300 [Oryza sativa Japonica Group]
MSGSTSSLSLPSPLSLFSSLTRWLARAAAGGRKEGTRRVVEVGPETARQWAKVEDKYAVTAIGVAALVGLWTAIGAIKAIDRRQASTFARRA